jgi:hypothetical protein
VANAELDTLCSSRSARRHSMVAVLALQPPMKTSSAQVRAT